MAAPLGGMGAPHRPVLLRETIQFLVPERGGLFIDCTVGLGGHSEAILESSTEARVIGIDLDKEALDYASKRLERFGERFRPVQSNFREISAIHPATRTFQALRIAVNRELEGLDHFVAAATDLLQPDGRFVAISFHSLEDRIIK